ncbi:hypothetical protein D8Y24_10660 [Agrococcus lahaulensis]|uniref:hypothetical protein n=1 Tax=Agrococcus sp. SCSIO52902 TaxID=2933290 RepID=UPI000FE33C60|nr:hypothetical protein [Agrococcus sp. SCSIO52902]RWR19632.1 hypothetical protein D8Y24_10660 [Agrococcus lahaulensis]UOV99807.1 hypothetical protein MU522_07530 [Agrococcus sp. SCSIO52902]
MRHRSLAAAAAAVVVALAATGCNILTPQATTIQYDASDGISGQTGTVEFHNAMLIGEPEGDALNLAVTFTNDGEATFVEVRVDDEAQQVRIPSGVTTYGFPEQQLVFEAGGDIEFGAQRNVSFQADGAEPAGVGVQVFSTEFPDYADLAPVAGE